MASVRALPTISQFRLKKIAGMPLGPGAFRSDISKKSLLDFFWARDLLKFQILLICYSMGNRFSRSRGILGFDMVKRFEKFSMQ